MLTAHGFQRWGARLSSRVPSVTTMTALRLSRKAGVATNSHTYYSSTHLTETRRLLFGAVGFPSGVLSVRSTGIRFASEGAKVCVFVPSMGDSISEGSIARWNKKVGEVVREGEVVAVVETDKVSVDINSPMSGILTNVEAKEGDTIFVGDPLFEILPSEDALASTEQETVVASTEQETVGEMVENAADQTELEAMKDATCFTRQKTEVPMSRMRQSIAKRLKGAQDSAAALTTFNEVDMSAVIKLRADLAESFKAEHNVKLGFMSPFIAACAKALIKCPVVNATLVDHSKITYHNYVDVSVAVATPTGLVVPVIRDCQQKTFADLEKALLDLSSRAREGRLKMEEMAGGTFTLSNGGIYGSMMGTPLLNPPQSAILGMHTINHRPVAVNGEIVIRPMMYLALTYDHQLIDGREAVTFLKLVKEYLEDPRKLLIDC